MSPFGEDVATPETNGQRPKAHVPAWPPTPWMRRLGVMVAALAVVLVLNVIEVNLAEHDPVPTQPTDPQPIDFVGPTPADLALTQVVSYQMDTTETDPAAWSYVTEVRVVSDTVVVQVGTRSQAVVERVCRQARRYMYSPNPYGPKLRRLMIFSDPGRLIIGLDSNNDACFASRLMNP